MIKIGRAENFQYALSFITFSNITWTSCTVIPQFWRPWFWRPSPIGDIIYLVSSWAHLLHTYNLDFGDFDFGDVNFARSQKSPKSRDDCNQFFWFFSDACFHCFHFFLLFCVFCPKTPHIQGPNPESHRSPRYHFRIPLELSCFFLLSPFHPVSSVAFGLKFVFSLVFTVKPRNLLIWGLCLTED